MAVAEDLSRVASPWSFADKALRAAAVLWFLVAAAGQWLFVYYIVNFFYGPTLAGDFAAWDRNKLMPHGYVAGDTVGNLALAAHVLLAAIVTFGGTLQLIPQIRARAIWLHRWNGRVFILVAVVISIAGLLLHAIRGTFVLNGIAIGINAVLIWFCAAQTLGFALARDIDTHRRWALRTFMVVNGVWFLRVGFSAWILFTQGLVATPKFDVGFFLFWAFGSYLVPLAVLELYLRTENEGGAVGKLGVALLVAGLAVVMAVGIYGAHMIFWRPLLT
jgi:uncharacterized membrane protein